MNTRLLTSGARPRNSSRRADFSPVRSIRLTPVTGTPSSWATSTPSADGQLHIDGLTPRPAWHRGALDRLQPVLTRYRD